VSPGPGDRDRSTGAHVPPARRSRALLVLLAVCAALVVHGSLYPYRFEAPQSLGDALGELVDRGQWWTSRGDVLGNIVLFIPLGALAQWVLEVWKAPRAAALLTMLAGGAIALGLQVAQLFVPERDAELADVLWNAVGLALGVAAAMLTPAARLGLAGQPVGRTGEESARLRLAATLAVLWLALHWWPFVPTLDWQQLKGTLDAWRLGSYASPGAVIGAALGVAVIAHLMRPLANRRTLLLALCAAALAGRLLSVWQWLTLSLLVGMAVGLLVAELAARASDELSGRLLFWGALLWFVLEALRPYRFVPYARPFHWLPFEAMLHGSMLANLLALCWNLFWLGAVVSLAAAWSRSVGCVTLLLTIGVALVELIQTRLPGRVADITPALLPALWWLVTRAAMPTHHRR
jgi:VanZ family protein